MDAKLLITQVITLLYLESQLPTKEVDSRELAKEILNDVKLTESVLDTDADREIIGGLRSTVFYICEQNDIDPISLKQRLRLNTKGDTDLYEIIVENFEEPADEETLRKRILHHTNLLNKHQKEKQFRDVIKKWVSDVLYSSTETALNVTNIAAKMQSELERFVFDPNALGPRGIAGVVGAVNFDNIQELENLFAAAEKETCTDGILRTGWQCINRMMGWHDGYRRGDFVLVGALQHNFKTGFTLKLLQQFVTYNKPWMIDPTKKPLMLHISSENALTDNVLSMYEYIYVTLTGKRPENDATIAEKAKFIREYASKKGYHLEMVRVDPTDFTYSSLFQMIMEYESMGYEIHMCMVDYLQMFNKAGCFQGPTGSDTRDLFRRVRNFMSKKKITFITPHQVASDAKYLLRAGVESFVKEIVNKGYYDSCKTIDQEVDVEILIHKVTVDGVDYLEIHRGKHRKSGDITPFYDLYAVLPFNPGGWGGILDDLNGADTSMRKPGARPMSEGGGAAWFQYAA